MRYTDVMPDRAVHIARPCWHPPQLRQSVRQDNEIMHDIMHYCAIYFIRLSSSTPQRHVALSIGGRIMHCSAPGLSVYPVRATV